MQPESFADFQETAALFSRIESARMRFDRNAQFLNAAVGVMVGDVDFRKVFAHLPLALPPIVMCAYCGNHRASATSRCAGCGAQKVCR